MSRFFLAFLLLSTISASLAAQPTEIAVSDESDAAYRFAVAQSLAKEGSYREALRAFAEVVELVPEEPYVRLEYAEFLSRLSRWRDAAEQANAARELAPDNVGILRLAGRVELNLAESDPAAMERARAAFETVVELEPGDRESALSLGQIYLSQGRAKDAADVFAGLLERYSGDRTAISFLIDALQRANDPARLEVALTEFLERDPEFLRGRLILSRLLSERGDHSGAAKTLGEAAGEEGQSVEIRRQLAFELYSSGETLEALKVVEEVLEEEPAHYQTRYMKAMIYTELRRDVDAEVVVAELVEEQPDNIQMQMALAQLRERQGKGKEAAAGLARAASVLDERGRPREARSVRLELASVGARASDWQTVLVATRHLLGPDSEVKSEARLLRSEALHRLNRSDEALEVLADVDPESPVASRMLAKQAEILFGLGRDSEAETRLAELTASGEPSELLLAAEVYQRLERHRQAIPVLLQAREGIPDSLQVLFWLGAAYERTGQLPEAEGEFRRLLTLDPEFAPALNYLGYMWTEQGQNLNEALEMVNRAVELEPDNGAYIDSLGWAYFQLGRYNEARDHLERAAELIPDDAVIVEHLGDLHQAVGDLDRAREYYRRAADLDGENLEQVRRKLDELDGNL
jgi:tetratricopeptide (TPR) repeat protein